jgi:hypothetical protein
MFNSQKTTSVAVDHYFSGLQKLQVAEAQHRSILDELDEAIQARKPNDITVLRALARDSEKNLELAWSYAYGAHQSYWKGRLESMMPEVEVVAKFLNRFNRVAYAAGDLRPNPVDFRIASVLANSDKSSIADEVPVESPECMLLATLRGCHIRR